MTGLTAILRKEVKNLFNSGWGVFFINALIVSGWSFMLFYEHRFGAGDLGIWLAFFAVVVSANFSATVFISERVSGTLEVLIVSGVTRDAVLFGKVFFVAGAAMAMGVVCAALSAVWVCLLSGPGMGAAASDIAAWSGRMAIGAPLYAGAAALNVSASAYLSMRMGNPRFLQFANLVMTAAVLAAYWVTPASAGASLALIFFALSAVFLFLARREFAGERITRPVIF